MPVQKTAKIGFELGSAIAEEPRCGVGQRKAVRHYGVDIPD
jgi:hypothetical protein